jgi:hypothetical protein
VVARRAYQAALTRPEAKEVLRVARLDGAHGAVLDSHNGAFGVERHRGCRIGVVVVVVSVCGRGVVVGVPLASVTARVQLRQRRAAGPAGRVPALLQRRRIHGDRGCGRGGGGQGRRVCECCSEVASSRPRWEWSWVV